METTSLQKIDNETEAQLRNQWEFALEKEVLEDAFAFNELLNRQPSSQWIKTNNGAKYLPIRIVENLLRSIFCVYQTEMIGEPKLIANSVVVSVQLKVYHPILKQWITHAGTGAVPIQVKKESNPTDVSNIISTALHKNVPSALSFAVSNAAKKLGKVFGSDLNTDELSETYNVYKNVQ